MLRELLVLSHLRWNFVWQRPQHLISRLASGYDRVWFVEEPQVDDELTSPRLRVEEQHPVTRVWLDLPTTHGDEGFDRRVSAQYRIELAQLVGQDVETAWIYTPMAIEIARGLQPTTLVYDVMDDLASFRFAAPELVLRQRQMLREANLVFTGGRSLHRSVTESRRHSTYCFPSGVDRGHYLPARDRRRTRTRHPSRPVAGYVGVIDERIDLELVAALARSAPDWDIRMVGPVVKIDPSLLPTAPNLAYPGPQEYADLPDVMGGFDVALMPFALNAATRSISPTKTLEYLAAGLPVVSTRVPDVVDGYTGVVDLRDDGEGFAAACRSARDTADDGWLRDIDALLHDREWDTIAAEMATLVDRASQGTAGEETA
jgi:glycosyltransferase involved in cell wall biosynthesis